MSELSWTKQTLYERFRSEDRISPTYYEDRWADTFFRSTAKILSTIGITFPVLYLIPNALKQTWSRQGKLVLAPSGGCFGEGLRLNRQFGFDPCRIKCDYSDSSSFTWHFDATKSSYLVIRTIHFEPMDEFSTEDLVLTWTNQQTDKAGPVNISTLPSEIQRNRPHPGMKKPMILILEPREVLDLTITNTNPLRPAFVEFELSGWFV